MAAEARLSFSGHECSHQDRDADDDEHVGEVERRPEANVEEVRYMSQPDPVDEVSEAASDQETERDRKNRVTSTQLGEEIGRASCRERV